MILPYCQDQHLGVIVYAPMASGLLTGAMTAKRVEDLPADDWRKRSPDFTEPNLSKHLLVADRLRSVGDRIGRTPGAIAIAWTLHHPAVTGAIVGARNAKQAAEVMGAGEIRLADEEVKEIEGK
jgi:aryl-alcohol dehydrogenase-like predicted oxidoreductase